MKDVPKDVVIYIDDTRNNGSEEARKNTVGKKYIALVDEKERWDEIIGTIGSELDETLRQLKLEEFHFCDIYNSKTIDEEGKILLFKCFGELINGYGVDWYIGELNQKNLNDTNIFAEEKDLTEKEKMIFPDATNIAGLLLKIKMKYDFSRCKNIKIVIDEGIKKDGWNLHIVGNMFPGIEVDIEFKESKKDYGRQLADFVAYSVTRYTNLNARLQKNPDTFFESNFYNQIYRIIYDLFDCCRNDDLIINEIIIP